MVLNCADGSNKKLGAIRSGAAHVFIWETMLELE
jgi:hypothetical protein